LLIYQHNTLNLNLTVVGQMKHPPENWTLVQLFRSLKIIECDTNRSTTSWAYFVPFSTYGDFGQKLQISFTRV